MAGPAHLALLLHMHQPLYVDPLTRRAEMPWVRLHGGRSYLDLGRLLDEYESVRLTVNFVPSLVTQLEQVVAGARDAYLEVAERATWTPDERVFLVSRFFSVHWVRHVETRPRYRELLEKRGRELPEAETARRAAAFSDGELRDLTVLFHLAWLGFAAREGDLELAELERKGRGYDAADLALVVARGRDACARVLPLYRKLAERGQIELSASPYYHPIVPLLCDSDVARRAIPHLALPERFAWPPDARLQIERAMAAHARAFGSPPRGMWPSEGSISPEAVATYHEVGVKWLASDEGNLWRSLERAGEGGAAPRPSRGDLYRAWQYGNVDLVFRDHELSDRIGFSYAFSETRAAVDDFLGRAKAAAAQARAARGIASGPTGPRVPAGLSPPPPLVTVALDGENPWEAYPGHGEPFLRALFEALPSDPELRPVTVSQHLAESPVRAPLERLHSGSWIDADFHIWIGDPVKNRAWEMLGRARRRYERAVTDGLDEAQSQAALEHLLAAEGSDWFWWFGEPFQTSEKPLFDRLFRAHLVAAWLAMGQPPPAELAEPVATGDVSHRLRPPRNYVRPHIDGRRAYYDWLDAGRFEIPRGSAMAAAPIADALYFGFDESTLYLCLEPVPAARRRLAAATVELVLRGPGRELQFVGEPGASALRPSDGNGRAQSLAAEGTGAIACGEILELGLPLDALGFPPGALIELAVRLFDGGIQVARYPGEGFLQIRIPGPGFAAEHWSV